MTPLLKSVVTPRSTSTGGHTSNLFNNREVRTGARQNRNAGGGNSDRSLSSSTGRTSWNLLQLLNLIPIQVEVLQSCSCDCLLMLNALGGIGIAVVETAAAL